MSRTNETRHIKWYETCKCKSRLNTSVCDKGFIWNPSNCECDKLCDAGDYLHYKNYKCRKRLIDKLVEE